MAVGLKKPLRILLVDDHELLRAGVRAFLTRAAGCTIVGEVASAEEAFRQLRTTEADLVIMDLNMAGMDGIAATARLKADRPRTKVLILAADSGVAGAVQSALLAGADGFVFKEDGQECLVPAVAALAGGRDYLSAGAATALVAQLRAEAAQGAARGSRLTERELAVLARLAVGSSYKQIASELGIAVKAVDTCRTSLTRKLGISTRQELVNYAIEQGLIRN